MTISELKALKSTLNFRGNNIKIYNNQKYQIDIVLANLQGNFFAVNLSNLVSLEIEEDSRKWYKRASLTIRNPDNIIEVKTTANDSGFNYYKFRNDGRDIVLITVKLINNSTIKETGVQVDNDVWAMDYTFVVYDKEERLTGNTTKQKELKLYLWEFDYQILLESNLDWSTNELLPKSIVPAQAKDEEKLVYTGPAIKSLISKALALQERPVFDNKEWDQGSSKIFYNSFANNNAAEDLEYLLKKHVSEPSDNDGGRDPCILSRTRYNNVWQLRSYTSLFNKAVDKRNTVHPSAGPLQREILTISYQNGITDSQSLFAMPFSPFASTIYPNTNYSDPIRSRIINMEVVDMAAMDNTEDMVSAPCYSNNFKDKTFFVNFADTSIENIKRFIDNNYSQKLKLLSKPDTLLSLNKTKIENRSLKNRYSFAPDKNSRLADSRNLTLLRALFLNTGICFSAPGSLIRQANTFVSVESSRKGVTDEFQNKLLGQWFVYNVGHYFTENDYINNVNAVRLHANDNIDIKNDID